LVNDYSHTGENLELLFGIVSVLLWIGLILVRQTRFAKNSNYQLPVIRLKNFFSVMLARSRCWRCQGPFLPVRPASERTIATGEGNERLQFLVYWLLSSPC